MADWQFPILPADLVESEPTQRDQFNNDEVGLSGALVREVIQNSSDAPAGDGPVKVRFALHELKGSAAVEFAARFQSLIPHLDACAIPKDALTEAVGTVLVVEDFNTTGLTGATDALDEANFRNFWRRHGRGGKAGKAGGRWGLGKLVYSSSSRLNCFFGLTVRQGETTPLLMGQAVLCTHEFDGHRRPAHGFWFGERTDDTLQLQLPVSDAGLIKSFVDLTGISRTNESGLSVAIPYPHRSITEKSLIEGVVENYYFPILAGRLVVEVGDLVIDRESFLEIAENHGLKIPLAFVAAVSKRLTGAPDFVLPVPVGPEGISEAHFPEGLEELRSRLAAGELLHIRVPLEVVALTGPEANKTQVSHFDVFLQNPETPGDSYSLYVRGALTVPGERRYFSGVSAWGAMVASGGPVAALLGDAENPAHTSWNASAEKLAKGWRKGDQAVRIVRYAPRQLQQLLGGQVEEDDPQALVDFFSLIDEAATPKAKRKRKSIKPVVTIKPKERSLIVQERKGGFSLVAGPGAATWAYPCQIRMRCAYDIIGADPFKRWSPFDFGLEDDSFELEFTNAEAAQRKGNVLRVTLKSADFRVDASGFDENRDLLVEARSV